MGQVKKVLGESTPSRSKAAIYRKAAWLIEQGRQDRSCCAIVTAQGLQEYEYSDERNAYTDLMLHGREVTHVIFAGIGSDSPEATDIRILLLCLMAAIVEAGDA